MQEAVKTDISAEKALMREQIQSHLDQVILPFWENLKDSEYGGFYGYMDIDLKLDKEAVKGCILNNRILWFFSNAYLTLKRPELLAYAKHAYEFLKNACLDREYGGVYWSVSFDGKPVEDLKHTYNQAFAIYALSSYYDASGDQEALDIAWSIYEIIEKHCKDDKGYLEAFDRRFLPVDNEKLSENGVMAEKTMNTLLHVFEGYTELYRVTKDEKVGAALRWMLDIFAKKVYNPDKKRQEVFFDKDWNTLIDLYSYGHDIETSWLIDRGVEILGDEKVREMIGPVTDTLAEQIYHIAYIDGSVINECERGVNNTTRVWWVQAESVLGFMNYYEKHPQKTEYFEAAKEIWDYIQNRMTDKRPGSEWFWDLDENGQPSSKKPIVEPWKCPYHNGRMCFEMIQRLQTC